MKKKAPFFEFEGEKVESTEEKSLATKTPKGRVD